MQQPTDQAEWHQLYGKARTNGIYDHASILWTIQVNGKTFIYIITFGGFSSKGSNLKEEASLIVFSLDKHKFLDFKASSGPQNRVGHTLCVDHNNNLLLFGGVDFSGKSIFGLTRIVISIGDYGDVRSVQYTELRSLIQISYSKYDFFRVWHNAYFYKGTMHIYGGRNENSHLMHDLLRWCPRNELWELCDTKGDVPAARENHSSILSNHKLYVFGGCSDLYLNEIHVLDLTEMKWTNIIVQGPKLTLGRRPAAQVVKNEVYFFGGKTAEENYDENIWTFSLDQHTWKQLNTTGKSPKARASHTIVEWKESLYMLGGNNCDEVFGDIHKLEIYNSSQEHKISTGRIILKDLFLDKEFADVIFKVEDQEFYCHKAILCKGCQYFHNMFTSGMSESQSKEITLSNINPTTFKAVLAHIYSQDNTTLTEEIALDLLPYTDEYQLPDLKKECERVLSGVLRIGNYYKFATIAQLHAADQLNEAVLDFATNNLRAIRNREDFFELSKEFLHKIISNLESL